LALWRDSPSIWLDGLGKIVRKSIRMCGIVVDIVTVHECYHHASVASWDVRLAFGKTTQRRWF
jgi:hypothetical protein